MCDCRRFGETQRLPLQGLATQEEVNLPWTDCFQLRQLYGKVTVHNRFKIT